MLIFYFFCRVFMSDDVPAFWNAFSFVFQCPNTPLLLCTWHVDKNWRQNLKKKIKDGEIQATVYKALCVLRLEQDKTKFKTMLDQFITWISEDVQTKEFAQYFLRHYVSKVEY